MEHIPAHIFDWIEQHSFAQLNPEQQKEVEEYFTKSEYDELYNAAQIAATYSKQGQEKINTDGDTLTQLQQHFDSTYPAQPKVNPLSVLVYWKAAAAVLLIAVGIASFGWYNAQHKDPKIITHTVVDTVFINSAKQLPRQEKIYDSVSFLQHRQPIKQQPLLWFSTPQAPIQKKQVINLSPTTKETPMWYSPLLRSTPKHSPKKEVEVLLL